MALNISFNGRQGSRLGRQTWIGLQDKALSSQLTQDRLLNKLSYSFLLCKMTYKKILPIAHRGCCED